MATHLIPDGEADRHTPCGGCHCNPWEQAADDGDGGIVWEWHHEPLGERRQRRLTGLV